MTRDEPFKCDFPNRLGFIYKALQSEVSYLVKKLLHILGIFCWAKLRCKDQSCSDEQEVINLSAGQCRAFIGGRENRRALGPTRFRVQSNLGGVREQSEI